MIAQFLGAFSTTQNRNHNQTREKRSDGYGVEVSASSERDSKSTSKTNELSLDHVNGVSRPPPATCRFRMIRPRLPRAVLEYRCALCPDPQASLRRCSRAGFEIPYRRFRTRDETISNMDRDFVLGFGCVVFSSLAWLVVIGPAFGATWGSLVVSVG